MTTLEIEVEMAINEIAINRLAITRSTHPRTHKRDDVFVNIL